MCDSNDTKSQNSRRTTDEAFQEHCFLWERGTIVGADTDTVSTFHLFYMHVNLKIHTEGKEHNRPLPF